MELFVNVLIIMGLIFMIWVLFCNERTLRDRIKIVTLTNYVMRKSFNKITYDKHIWYRITFRNPLKLYSQEIQDKFKNNP